jgi:tetratricopeptide (TPR) repeat protein
MRRFATASGVLFISAILLPCSQPAAGADVAEKSEPAISPAIREPVEKWIAAGVADAKDREAAEVVVSTVSADAWPAVVETAEKAQSDRLNPEARQWLKEMLERQRPYFEARIRRQQAVHKRWEWNLRTALEAYEHAGRKNPKWDAAARRGISGFVAITDEQREDKSGLAEAISAGCDDPLVNYFYARTLEQSGSAEPEKIDRLYQGAVTNIEQSEYPPSRKLYAFLRYYHFKYAWENKKAWQANAAQYPRGVPELLGRLRHTSLETLWPATCGQKDIDGTDLLELSKLLFDAHERGVPDRKEIFDWMYPPFEKAASGGIEPLVFRGYFYYKYAWDARGSGWANTVTPDGWQKMGERLNEAEAALTKAYELDPQRPEAATEMLSVELGQGKGRDAMEKWFQRAMTADPDNKAACHSKMYYLEPKWFGSPQEMIAFGLECRESRNWRGDLPFMLIEAHESVSKLGQDLPGYFALDHVWKDVQSVYEPFLAARPKNAWARSRYAYYASLGRHWDVASQQFRELGETAIASQFGGAEAMQEFRRQASENAPK